MNTTDYKAIIKPLLSEKRYIHSVNVAKEAVRLAKRYGANPEKAEVAGILHDIMKDTPPDEQLKMMMRFDIILTDVERDAQKLWHAICGAAYIEQELQISDRDILDAVRYHTTGRANMTQLEKVIFIADFISADRDYDGVERMRKAAEISLEQAMLEGVVFTIQDLSERFKPIHPDTVSAYNWVVLDFEDKVKSKNEL
ncbi:MAG TPA: bis(5'-nucleosyl)-tetraphosphatase (symmetrical) YqeK [Oscillospiraceae bacterium]|nr:bis(5'-nucleosyl)-tetraphosphatase (symmetrical) YqeK [Oscillospiraceae bacterium]